MAQAQVVSGTELFNPCQIQSASLGETLAKLTKSKVEVCCRSLQEAEVSFKEVLRAMQLLRSAIERDDKSAIDALPEIQIVLDDFVSTLQFVVGGALYINIIQKLKNTIADEASSPRLNS